MNRQTKLRAIDRLVEYMKESEKQSYEEFKAENNEGPQFHHIYDDVLILEQIAFDYIHPWTQKAKVEQMEGRAGRPVENQFIITTDDGRYFQSYSSVIAFRPYGEDVIYLDENTWDYSTTTGKYRNEFLGEGIADTRKKIESGAYKLVNLN